MTTSNNIPALLTNALPMAGMTAEQIARLPIVKLQDAHATAMAIQTALKAALDRMHAALEQRYAARAQETRFADGRDFGVAHLIDGDFRITVDLPENVSWDQEQLAATAARIAAAGDNVADYIDTEYSISKSRFKSWPPALREQFAAARTAKPGKATYKLAPLEAQGGK